MLKALTIDSIKDCPNVYLNKEQNRFEFSGRSLLLNPIEFSEPIFNWIDEYVKNPNQSTIINFCFEYVNSASIRMLIDILIRFKTSGTPGLKITWCVEEDDEIMYERGEELANVLKVPFEYIFIKETD